MRRSTGVLPGLLVIVTGAVDAQAPRYGPEHLARASFDLRIRATVRSETGGATRIERIGREGRLEVRGVPDPAGVRVEAWFDSLHVWREGPEGRLEPETDGVVGGRFRGLLDSLGGWRALTRPFVPDELAEVTDVGATLDGLLPPLPGLALPIGGRWDDGALRIVRRADSTAQRIALARYRWSVVRGDTAIQATGDSLAYTTRVVVREEGDLIWHPTQGPVAWVRRSITDLDIPAEGAVRRAARSRVEEEVRVWRRTDRGT